MAILEAGPKNGMPFNTVGELFDWDDGIPQVRRCARFTELNSKKLLGSERFGPDIIERGLPGYGPRMQAQHPSATYKYSRIFVSASSIVLSPSPA